MYEFGITIKLISLTKVCMNDTKYQVKVDKVLSEEFQVVTTLKQGDTLSPLLFNIAYGVYKRIIVVSTLDQRRLVFYGLLII